MKRGLLYARTVRHLSLRQIAARIRLRLHFAVLARLGDRLEARWVRKHAEPRCPGWPSEFAPLDVQRFSSAEEGDLILSGAVTLLNEKVTISDVAAHGGLSRLRRYHLFYLDWIWNVSAVADDASLLAAFRQVWTPLLSGATFGAGDEWFPYVVSLRVWTLCGLHARSLDSPLDREFLSRQIARHYEFLVRHTETDVGGNHLIKNLKGLVGAAVSLGDTRLIHTHLDELVEELSRQVLDDGGHFELSQSYHAQVLGDAIDVADLLARVGHESASKTRLDSIIERMRTWLANFVRPDGRVASFNDGFVLDEDELERLGVPRGAAHPIFVLLTDTGYAVFRPASGVLVAMDVGRPCPPTLPAHAQADCLSITLSIGADNLLVDSGTSEYGNGPRRAYERSTAAHSTVELDDQNQTEVWGAFRAARRAAARVVEFSNDGTSAVLTAEHDGYTRLRGRPIHSRTVAVTADSLRIDDHISGRGTHRIVSRLMLGTTEVEQVSESSFRVNGRVTIECSSGTIEATEMEWSEEFGRLLPGTCLSSGTHGPLPGSVHWKVTWTS